ncbi:MAG: carboxylase [Betaproteobacteria bacterium]|nr:carboxylase [Betaproteobacteria bacterium]
MNRSSMKEIKIIDQTIRDAHQSLWASRMTTAMMLPVAERMDRIGFAAIDFAGAVHFDVGVRYLKENPWEKIRLIRRKITATPMITTIRSRGGIGFNVVPNDILLLWIERLIANGMRIFRVFDPLLDLDNNIYQLKYAKELGAYTVGVLAYGHSPVHTDELYTRKAEELIERSRVDAIMLKDELHTHCTTGLGPLVALEGVKHGADQVHTSIAPLANGTAQPATQTVVRNLRSMGYPVNVDDALIDEVSAHFRKVTEQEGKPLGVPAEYDAFHFEHQVPGGMISNFKAQLAQAGLSHKLDEVLHECARVRAELGWPIMITPFSQYVGTLAVLNVVHGERYRVIPDEVKKYALGYNGKLLAPIESGVLDRILENGSQSIPAKPPPLEPGVPGLRKKYPDMSDEERLLRYSYAGSQVDELLAAGPIQTEYHFEKPLVRLLNELTRRPKLARVYIENRELHMELSVGPHKPDVGRRVL